MEINHARPATKRSIMAGTPNQCQFEFKSSQDETFPCQHACYHDSSLCIFHDPNIEAKKADFKDAFSTFLEQHSHSEETASYDLRGFHVPIAVEFLQQTFDQAWLLDGCTFYDDVHFYQCTFKQSVSAIQTKFLGNVSCKQSVFENNVTLIRSQFSGNSSFIDIKAYRNFSCRAAIFNGTTSFRGSELLGAVSLREAECLGDISFKDTLIEGHTTFQDTILRRDISFRNFQSKGDLRFVGTHFEGQSDFQNAHFYQGIIFEDVQFQGSVQFQSTQFHHNVEFLKVTFQDSLIFKRNLFQEPASITHCTFHHLKYRSHIGDYLLLNQCQLAAPDSFFDFRDTNCAKLKFLNMALQRADFLGADISKTTFDSCDWNIPKDQPYLRVYRHQEIEQEGVPQLKLLRSLYQQLKLGLAKTGDYQQSGDCHFREMEIRMKLSKVRKQHFEYLVLSLYLAISDFGENYKRLAMILGGSLAVTTWAIAAIEQISSYDGIFEYLNVVFFGVLSSTPYHSQVELQTWSKVVLVTEGVLVGVLTLLLMIALYRRFRR